MLYQLHIPYTLTLVANTGTTAMGQIKRGFVSEFDCTIDVDYNDHEDFEIISVTFEQSRWADEFHVDAKSDPDLWKLMTRAFDYDWKDLGDKIRECIVDDISESKYNRPESYEDVSMGR